MQRHDLFAISLKFVTKFPFGDFKAVPIQINHVFVEKINPRLKIPRELKRSLR